MNIDVLTTKVADGIAVITLGSANRVYFDAEAGDALTEALESTRSRKKEAGARNGHEAKKITLPSRGFEV